MRIGITVGSPGGPDATLSNLIARAKDVEARGFSSCWMPNIFAHDAITALALAGHETERIELGTAVVPTYPRHPMALAQQACTAQAAAGGRFTLGIGLSHKIVIEDMFGLSYDKPARHMREYLEVLTPLLRGEAADWEGEQYQVKGGLEPAESEPPGLVIAALGDVMLKLAGQYTDGTILWMTGPQAIGSHIAPKLVEAAEQAGRPTPRIIAGLPIILTNDPEGARARVAEALAIYGMLPSYRAMLDKEGADGPADVSLIGDEAELDAGLARLRDAGVTDFDAAVFPLEPGADERTLEYLQSKR